MHNDLVPHRPLGSTKVSVSALGIGGWHFAVPHTQAESTRMAREAIDAGVNFFDNAWCYHNGLAEERMGVALEGVRREVILMTKACTHGRGKEVALRQLEETLRRFKTDYLDVWQIHEVIYWNEPDATFAPGGVIEAMDQAKRQGKVRFVGFTGHKHPELHLSVLAHDYPFDTVQMPLNCMDAHFQSFEKRVLPEARRRGMGVFGMKSMGGGGEIMRGGVTTAEEALRYAMSLPVASVISGIDSLDVLRRNLAIARGFQPLSSEEMDALRKRTCAAAGDGRFELYKTSIAYDGPEARRQHGFPPITQTPA
jgi:aryl-alcohol dehydrogenase-like predicted oxidoreductase